MHRNEAGQMIESAWRAIPDRFPCAQIDEYIVMPNHLHGILRIVGDAVRAPLADAPSDVRAPLVGALQHDHTVRAPFMGAPRDVRAPFMGAPDRHPPSLGEMIGAFKSISTNEYIKGVKQRRWPSFTTRLWHRNFYEHIVRNDDELEKIRDYIRRNPLKWECDRYNPARGAPVVDEDGRVVTWENT